jgi:hypothetical protein
MSLQWQSGDVDGDALSYTLKIGTNASMSFSTAVTNSVFGPGNLLPQTEYFWQVVASDGKTSTAGPVWEFATQPGARPHPQVSSAVMTPGGFQIQFSGIVGQTYYIVASTNQVNWTAVTNVVAAGIPTSVIDSAALNYSTRFYRILDTGTVLKPIISGFRAPLNSPVQFVINGTPGLAYMVQVSTDLAAWQNLTSVSLSQPQLLFTDTNSVAFTKRFYRLLGN